LKASALRSGDNGGKDIVRYCQGNYRYSERNGCFPDRYRCTGEKSRRGGPPWQCIEGSTPPEQNKCPDHAPHDHQGYEEGKLSQVLPWDSFKGPVPDRFLWIFRESDNPCQQDDRDQRGYPSPYCLQGETEVEIVDALLKAETRLGEMRDSLAAQGINVRAIVKTGSPAHEITRIADEEDVSVIWMNSYGKGWFRDLLLGSTASTVAMNAKQPVLIIRTME